MKRSREIELKLEAVGDVGPELLQARPVLEGCPPVRIDSLSSTYFDTPDRRFRDAGFTLRVRRSDGRFIQTVKQGEGGAGLFDRPEWEEEITAPEPDFDAAARTPLGALLNGKTSRAIEPVATVEVSRSIWLLRRGDGEVELVHDRGEVRSGTAVSRVAELELELKSGAPDLLFQLARELADALPLKLGVLTKAERGFALGEGSLGRPAKAEGIVLPPDATVPEGFAAIAGSCLRQFRLNEILIAEQGDASALHQARVAMRRLRSAFALFRPVIVDEAFPELRAEVRWFTDQLGDARNLDVLLKRFDKNGADEELHAILSKEREAAYDRVRAALGSARLRRLMLELVAWIQTGAWRDRGKAEADLAGFADKQLGKRWRKVKKGGRDMDALDPEPLHRLRIEVKKLRYAVEFMSSLYTGKEARRRQKASVSALEDMQEALGELNDAETGRDLLQGLLGSHLHSKRLLADAAPLAKPANADPVETARRAYGRLVKAGKFWG